MSPALLFVAKCWHKMASVSYLDARRLYLYPASLKLKSSNFHCSNGKYL